MFLAGDAAHGVGEPVVDNFHGMGTGALEAHLEKLQLHNVAIHLSNNSCNFRGVDDPYVAQHCLKWLPTELVRRIAACDKALTYQFLSATVKRGGICSLFDYMSCIPVHHYKTYMTTSHVITRAELEVEVSQAIGAYLQCFLANDMDGINAKVAYPLSLISDGHTSLCSEFPMSPKQMMEETGWHTTVNIMSAVAGVNGNKAHVTSSGTRVRKDGSVIENYDVFYALTKTSGNWKIFSMSQVVYPVSADQS